MRTLIGHVNVTLPFVVDLEHNPIYLRFTNKFLAKQRELREIEEARKMVHRQTSRKEPGWWTKRFEKSCGVKEQINFVRKGGRKEISKEKLSEKETLVQVELETKEQEEGVTSEKTTIPTMDVMSMIAKKPGRKTIRKVGSKVSDKVSKTKVNEDTPHALREGGPLGKKIGDDENPEGENFQDLINALESFKVNRIYIGNYRNRH